MIKIVKDGIAYYMLEKHAKHVDFTRRLDLMQYSQVVVDVGKNEVIKNRWSSEQMVDKFTGVM